MKDSDIGLRDPIEEGFPVMVDASRRFCMSRSNPDNICYKYHRLWPYTRRIGFHSWRLDAGRLFYFLRAFQQKGRSTRILISGCADYSLLAWVLHAFGANGPDPQVTVLDICDAPLVVNRWYAERVDANITTVTCDILKHEDDSAFDVVLVSNFLRRFGRNDQSRIVAKWRDLLRPGGTVISVQGVSKDAPIGKEILSSDDVERKCDRVLKRAKESISLIDISPETLVEYYRDYMVTRSHFPHRTTSDLKTLFENNGFRTDKTAGLSDQEKHDWAKMHGKKKDFDRVCIVATKVG